jgi:3-deoxy-D-manno-octulosonate 8-phosphate phosphatase (KDO 8-P phosphatase)
MKLTEELIEKAKKIKLALADCDGVLTDTGVYYSAEGEVMKRFSIRDGMGMERLQKLVNVECGIITGEESKSILKRAEKLKLMEVHLSIKDKVGKLNEILSRKNLTIDEVAFMGDDTNDIDILRIVGLSACPSDATKFAKEIVDIIVDSPGGNGAFRDFAEMIIEAKTN